MPCTTTQAPDVYTVQFVLDLAGPLDSTRLRAAAAALLKRHANLRVAILHEGLERPVQVVPRAVELIWPRVCPPFAARAKESRGPRSWRPTEWHRSCRLPGRCSLDALSAGPGEASAGESPSDTC